MQQAIFNDFKLKLANRSDNFATIKLVGKQLRYAFVHQLVHSFSQLFRFHGIGIFNVAEHFGRETWQALEMNIFARRDGIADDQVS